jgi:hypothetical protein
MSNVTALQAPKQNFSLAPKDLDEALRFADMLASSVLVPKDYVGKPGNCLVAIQWGMELGLQPMQAMQSIAVINGRPSLWGDAMLGLVKSHPAFEWIKEECDGNVATCTLKRRGEPEVTQVFSMEDAKRAGLTGKQGPWTQYPKRMLQMRARGFALRDAFPDALRGLISSEEASDMPAERDMGAAEVVETRQQTRQTAQQTQQALPPYPADQFAANLPQWHAAIEAGKVSADQVIARSSSKYSLSEEQKTAIRTLPQSEPEHQQPAVDAEWTNAYEGAE